MPLKFYELWRVERSETPGNPRQRISGTGTFPEMLQ
jgi:hypothetical protein